MCARAHVFVIGRREEDSNYFAQIELIGSSLSLDTGDQSLKTNTMYGRDKLLRLSVFHFERRHLAIIQSVGYNTRSDVLKKVKHILLSGSHISYMLGCGSQQPFSYLPCTHAQGESSKQTRNRTL
eukprot:jgi/Botrbrau1/18406/Bobra.0869s0004.1